MRYVGFSTGAVAFGDFRTALEILKECRFRCIELSALRISEVRPLLEALPHLDLASYSYISLHAPSRFSREEELWLAELLYAGVPDAWPIILHPDTIHDFELWRRFEGRIAIENMDRRKRAGRSVLELTQIFQKLPEAGLCFDIGHSHQFDPSMTEAFETLGIFGTKLVQVHVSEVDSESHHEPVSYGTILAFHRVSGLIPDSIPIIVESRVPHSQIYFEAEVASESLSAHQAV